MWSPSWLATYIWVIYGNAYFLDAHGTINICYNDIEMYAQITHRSRFTC